MTAGEQHVIHYSAEAEFRADAAERALADARNKIEHLEIALGTSRIIGIAVGIVVERCRLSSDEAFSLLVTLSQRTHCKLRDIASELVFTGVIPDAV